MGADSALSDLERFDLLDQMEASATAALGTELARGLTETAFALIKPDALASGKLSQLVAFLEQAGIEVVWADLLLNPHLRQFEDLYKFNLSLANAKNQLGSWWINARTYLQGPSVLLLVRTRSPERRQHVYRTLNELKGPSTPHRGRPGHLRHDLNGSTRSVNLIHVSDDALSSFREFTIFRSAGVLRDTLQTLAMECERPQTNKAAQTARLRLQAIAGQTAVCEDLDFLSVHARLLLRAAALCRLSEAKRDALFSFGQVLLEATGALEPMTCRARRYFDLLVRPSVLDDLGIEAAAIAVRAFKDFARLDEAVVGDLLAAIKAAGGGVSDWEEIVIVSGVHYADDLALLGPDEAAPSQSPGILEVEA